MITAVFNDKMDYTIAYGLWQWDYGQVLRVKGLDFDQISIEVHFSLSPDNTDSLVTIGVVKDVDYQSTIVSDGEEYTVNETATVLDVVIPKNMLWNNIKKNYTIYVFLLSTNEESGETLKRIIMPVKVKPKPLYSVTPEDEELFHRVVEEVNTFAETAKEHSNISKSYAVGNTGTRENENIDNAKYYAEQSALSAEASEQSASNALVSENHALDSENSALGAESRARAYAIEARDLKQEYDNTLALTKEYRDSAQASAISASANLRDTVTARNIATQASADANNFLNQTQAVYDLTVEIKQKVDETKADVDITKTEIDAVKTDINATQADITATRTEIATTRAEVNTAKNEVIAIKSEVSDIKDATDEIKTDVISIANNINNSISEHNESTTAHSDIRNLISNLTNKLNTFLDTDDESLDQISELITFIQNNRTLIEGITTSKIDKNQGIENAYKSLIVGEDGYVTLGDIGYYPVEITSVNSNYQANHTCKEISDAFKDGLIPYAFIHGVEQNIFYLMTCSESLVGFVYLTKDNISIITISQDNTTTVNTNNPIIHTHQDISHKADKATTLTGYGITNAYTKGEVDNIINNLDTGVTSVNNKTGNVTITAQELGALTEHQDISGKADKSEIPTVPTNVSAFTNDSGYINDLSSYIYYSQNTNTVYINSATETDADDVITINDRVTAVEDALNDTNERLTQQGTSIGDLSQLNTEEKTNLVAAINEATQVDTTLSVSGAAADAKAVGDALAEKADAGEIGDLSQLTTTAKNSLVSAINEANERLVQVDDTLTISGAAADAAACGDLKSALDAATVFYDDELGIGFRPIEGSASSSSTPYEQIHILDLPLVAGKTYKIDWSIPAEVSPYVVYCFLSDGQGNNLIQSRIAAGDTTKTETYTATTDYDNSYLYFTVGNVQVTVSATVTMTNQDPTRIDKLEAAVDALEDTTAKKVESRSVEITNPDTGHYINKNGGYSASNPFSISQAFNVYAGETIEVIATGYNNDPAVIAQVKSNYPYIVLARSRSSVEETYTYTVLEDMSVVVSYDNRKPCTIIVKKIYDLDVIPQMQAELRDAKWKYAFDRICCIGDSLTSGAYYAGTWGGASIAQNYPNILSRMLNTTVKNSGRSGASAKTWYTNNMAGLTLSDYGTFVIWLGTNQGLTDTIATDVDPYDDYNDFADTNTGYLCRTICQIKEAVPDAHIMICTVFSTSGDLATTNDVINQVASKYALQLVDNSDLDNTNYPLYHSNAVHFNKAGNIFIADRIKNAMISYVAPDGRNAEFGLTARTD